MEVEPTTTPEQAMNRLIDYLFLAYNRRTTLPWEFKDPSATELLRDESVLVEDVGQARFSLVLADALELLGKDTLPDWSVLPAKGKVSKDQAVVLVKTFGGLRPASRATGLSRNSLFSALHRNEMSNAYVQNP